MIGLIHIVIGSFHVCYVYRGALRRLMHTEVCIGLDIAHFPSLMYGFIMQQVLIEWLKADAVHEDMQYAIAAGLRQYMPW